VNRFLFGGLVFFSVYGKTRHIYKNIYCITIVFDVWWINVGMLTPKLGVVVTALPLYGLGSEAAPQLFEKSISNLSKLKLEIVPADEVVTDEEKSRKAAMKFREKEVDLICLIAGTWTPDTFLIEMLNEIDTPFIIWAIPDTLSFDRYPTLSLCGTQLLCSTLKEFDREYRFFYGEVSNDEILEEIYSFSKAVALRNRLKRSKICMVGYRPWVMAGLSFDEVELKRRLGPSLIHLGLDDFLKVREEISDEDTQKVWSTVKEKVGKVLSDESECLLSIKSYLALRKIVDEKEADALTVECEPKLKGKVCLANSLLNDEGIPAACESDVNSAVAMLILHLLSGKPVLNGDIIGVFEKDNSMVFSHCGAGPLSLAEDKSSIILDINREVNSGVSVFYTGKPGDVTIVNLVGRKGTYRMCILSGKAVKTELLYPGNPTKVRFSEMRVREIIETIAYKGFGHHWNLVHDNLIKELTEYCSLVGIDYVLLR